MIYRCLWCNYKEARGCLPTVSCGLYLLALFGIGSGGLLGLVLPLFFPEGLGWWWLIGAPVLLALAVPVAIILNWLLELAEWLAFCWRRCPLCGKRKWSWGFFEGFGL
jgi:hypothetical protein